MPVKHPIPERAVRNIYQGTKGLGVPRPTYLSRRIAVWTRAENKKMPIDEIAEAVFGAVLGEVFDAARHGFSEGFASFPEVAGPLPLYLLLLTARFNPYEVSA